MWQLLLGLLEKKSFERVNLIAIDKAKNKTISKVPLYIKDLKIKNDKIKISENFIKKVSIPVLQKSDFEISQQTMQRFLLNKTET
ncbi:MAG: hypothetical protein ACNI22_16665 [Halarcobacter sp.]